MKITGALLAGLLANTVALAAPAPISGRWITADGSGLIVVGPCGAKLCGRLTKVLRPNPDAPSTDRNNPDPALRGRPIVGLPILTDFAPSGESWRGRIYDPRNGKTYKSIVTRAADGTLKVQGCILFLCQTQVWRAAP